MQNNRLGCLTATGISAALVALFIIVGVAFASGGRMFSPGELNAETGILRGGVASHAQIDKCSSCHSAPWEKDTMADRCAACHADIAAQMFNVAELHGAISEKNPNLACRDCHPDHRGSSASLVDLKGGDFPHDALGFSLKGHQIEGQGKAFNCDACHQGDVRTFVPDSCINCHRQVDIAFTQAHALSFGMDCLACHDGVDRYGDDFTHNAFNFKLTGMHVGVSCSKCHLDARTIADLQSTPQGCNSCHLKDDPHQGRFGQDCAACHTTSGWKPAKFDHNLADFKLEGEHAEVTCEKCHVDGAYKGTPKDCYSCHKDNDEHGGKFGTDCSACHTPKSWDDVTFDHNRTNFPLSGQHADVPCENCHKNGQFKDTPTACVSCHGYPAFHAGAFGANCADCHSVNSWVPAKFKGSHPGIADEGGSGVNHGGASCRTCHTSTVFEATCSACHSGNNFEGGGGGDD
ncbi:MAG: hypothetical protein K8S20_03810 [Chloroflexi bacterium]|nr:hypothetical protein [Chloroflexota bacterium]